MSTLISYAQNFEDIMLWRALSQVEDGCYVDVGAQSPDVDSVSRLFYEHGWRGVHVEPTPHYAGQLRAQRPDEVVLQMAVGERAGILTFFEIEGTGLSTGESLIAAEHRASGFQVNELRVPLVTLDTVLEQVGDRDVHWLKIDVEGAEKQVIDGWQQTARRPWLLVIESTRPLTAEQSHHEWEPAVLAKGYTFAYFDGLNRFYVSEEHPELMPSLAVPPNVFDDFSLSSSSTLCAQVNLAYQALERRGADEANALHGQIQALHTDADAVRHELRAQLDAARAERDLLEAQIARNDLQHAAMVDGMVMAHNQSLAEFQRLVSQEALALQAELASRTDEAEAGRHTAHKWWLAHEELRRQIQQIHSSRSWQLTRPLRAVRRRLSSGVLTGLKRIVRPVAVHAVRTVFAIPGLKRALKPLIARVPFLYTRLHSVAMQEQLFDQERSNRPPLEGREHDRTMLHMDKRARGVFEDLQRARKEGKAA